MDISSLIGVFGAFGMVVFSVVVGGGRLSSIMDLPSFLMVVLGSYFALLLSSSLSEGLGIFNLIGRTFQVPVFNEQGIITKLMSFSDKARREGLLALEDELEDLDDEFMKKGLRLVVDGTDAAIIRDLMELELSQMQGRHADKIALINQWGALAPGLGMLGTVIGLIGMLQNLDDKAAIGPNMALALVTTLYGSMVANLLMIPFSAKLRMHDAKESMVREMVIEGVLSIQAGDNTRILAMKLLAYLNPTDRKAVEAEVIKD
ncbi:MAG: MotA/TolQ/ExbB proton channel family protein [Treponema sp.]|jgi:chemotaxis protein MotA|nr:MotA/TolQ/ExbB proton channel family protein [Treponema sp.]